MVNNNSKCEVCGNWNNRGLSVDAIIVKDKHILLVKRGFKPYKDLWALPGGHVDFDETVKDSVVREVKEETNLDTEKVTFFGIYSDPKRHPKQLIAIAYLVQTKGEPKAGDDASECRYFSFEDLPKPLAFDHEKMIEDYIRSFSSN